MKNSLMILCVVTFIFGCKAQGEPSDVLKLIGTIPLDGVEGRIDHMAVDATNGRLFVAALGNNTVEVIDLKTARKTGQITGLKKPQGVAFLPDSNRLVVASGGDGKVRVYDQNQKLIGTVDGLDDADNVRYDPQARLVYVGYGDGALAVIDPTTVQKIADIKLDAHPESFQLEAKGNRIFVNVPDAKQVAVIDRVTKTVVAKWPLGDSVANFPMAVDAERHRLFLGCRRPAKLTVMDTETGKVVASLDCCGDTDDVFYDAARKRVYASGGDGRVSVFEQANSDSYKSVGQTTTAAGARTSLYVPSGDSLYVAVPHRGTQKATMQVFDCRTNN